MALESSKPADFPGYEEVDHTADLALRVRGKDLADLFKNAARGMTHLMAASPVAGNTPNRLHTIELLEPDTESLLVEWLGELVFLAETQRLIFHRFEIDEITPGTLKANLHGTPTPTIQKPIKAVTFHDLKIIRTDHGFETTVVFDV